jgi:hypothetical protein
VLLGKTPEQLSALAVQFGQAKYRGKQVLDSMLLGCRDVLELGAVPKAFREALVEAGGCVQGFQGGCPRGRGGGSRVSGGGSKVSGARERVCEGGEHVLELGAVHHPFREVLVNAGGWRVEAGGCGAR